MMTANRCLGNVAALLSVMTSMLVVKAHGQGQVLWRTGGELAHHDSSGNALTSSFIFMLGAFDEGFTPLASNTADWAAHWHSLSTSAYDESNQLASGEGLFATNDPPFTEANRGYIWGFRADGKATEWILLTHPVWVWPFAGGAGFPPTWATNNAGVQTVVGTVDNTPSAPVHLTTAAVSGDNPIITPQAWLAAYFTEAERNNSSISGWMVDTDLDGYVNLMEYALGGTPNGFDDSLGFTAIRESQTQPTTYLYTLNRLPNRMADSSLAFNDTLDVNGWSETLDPNMTLIQDTSTTHQVRVSTAMTDRCFARVISAWPGGVQP